MLLSGIPLTFAYPHRFFKTKELFFHRSDFNIGDFWSRFKHWQGPDTVQPKDAKRKKKCKGKGKGKIEESVNASHGTKEELKDSYEKAEAFCEAWSNNRRCIGLITSSAPRGR